MRVSLRSVSARIDRLAKRAHLSEDDLLAKCEAMSDEELELEHLRLIELVVGPESERLRRRDCSLRCDRCILHRGRGIRRVIADGAVSG